MNYYYHNVGRIPNVSDCSKDTIDGSHFPIGMCYVPWQAYHQIYPLEKGFCVGTLFPCLDKPFLGKAGCRR